MAAADNPLKCARNLAASDAPFTLIANFSKARKPRVGQQLLAVSLTHRTSEGVYSKWGANSLYTAQSLPFPLLTSTHLTCALWHLCLKPRHLSPLYTIRHP